MLSKRIFSGLLAVVALFGPSSVRETVALPLDRAVSPALAINGGGSQYAIVGLQIVNVRAGLLGASRVLDDIALDKYSFVRDSYLQRRRSLVRDGEEPVMSEAPDAAASAPAAAASGAATK